MGSQIAKAAQRALLGGEISDRARLVLIHICWTARDTPCDDQPAGEYWAGHKMIGVDLFGLRGTSKACQEKVRLAVNELIRAGLIERIVGGAGKDRTRYRVLVGGFYKPARAVDNYYDDPLV